MRTLIIIPTAAEVTGPCYQSVLAQDDKDRSLLISALKPAKLHSDPQKNKSLNAFRNRQFLRPMALASDAEWFLFVDSDVELPPNALSSLLRSGKKFVGGWYPKIQGGDWVAGRFIKDGLFLHYKEPQEGLIEADMIGMGCALIHRSVLEAVPFSRTGIDEYCSDERGNKYYIGNCTAYTQDAKKAGFPAYMDGSVICKHHPQRVVVFNDQTGEKPQTS